MTRTALLAATAMIALGGILAGLTSTGETKKITVDDKPINKMCPIGKEPIDNKATITYKSNVIGFCCGGCDKSFLKWDEKRKDEFVRVNMGILAEDNKAEAGPEQKRKSDLYTLNTCPVTGKELGSMGDPIIKEYEGREVRFCCKGCLGKFAKDKEEYFKKIDAAMIKQQLPYYPVDTCLVSGEELGGEMGDPIDFIHNNRLIRFCCKGCKRDFLKDSDAFLEKLDKAVIAKQREHYPLQTCPVSNEALDSMGEPIEKVYGNRLVRFCCKGCIKKFEKNPAAYVATIDKGWKEIHGMDADHDEHEDDHKSKSDHEGSGVHNDHDDDHDGHGGG